MQDNNINNRIDSSRAVEEEERVLSSSSSSPSPMPPVVIFILGLKGGVGKTFVCMNIARRLALNGYRVAVIDADLPSPNAIEMYEKFTLSNSRTTNSITITADNKVEPIILEDRLYAFSISRVFQGNYSISVDEQTYAKILYNVIRNTLWPEPIDFLLIDMPAGSGYVLHTLADICSSTAVVEETTKPSSPLCLFACSIIVAQEAHIQSCERLLKWHLLNKFPVFGVISNMNEFICKNCNTTYTIFGQKGQVHELCKRYGVSYLGSIPLITEEDITTYSYKDVIVLFDAIAKGLIYVKDDMSTKLKGNILSRITSPFTQVKKFITTSKEQLRELLIKVIIDIFKLTNTEIDTNTIATRYGYKGGRDIRLTIVTDREREPITTIFFIFKDGKMRIIEANKADPKLIISMTVRALVGSLLGYITVPKISIDGTNREEQTTTTTTTTTTIPYTLIDAYFNGELVIHESNYEDDPLAALKFIRDTWAELRSHPTATKVMDKIKYIAKLIE